VLLRPLAVCPTAAYHVAIHDDLSCERMFGCTSTKGRRFLGERGGEVRKKGEEISQRSAPPKKPGDLTPAEAMTEAKAVVTAHSYRTAAHAVAPAKQPRASTNHTGLHAVHHQQQLRAAAVRGVVDAVRALVFPGRTSVAPDMFSAVLLLRPGHPPVLLQK
jgi:hypothetical protein